MPGQLLTDVMPAARAGRAGGTVPGCHLRPRGRFRLPQSGRRQRVPDPDLRPVADADGTVVGGLSLTEDVTAERARQTLLSQMQQLSNVGCVSYDRVGGWVVDDELATLLGTEAGEECCGRWTRFVVPEDRAPTRSAYREVLASGGETTLQYRLVHGKTGRAAACDRQHPGDGGTAIGDSCAAIATVVDVTDVVDAQTQTVKAAAARTVLLRNVSDALARAPRSDRDMHAEHRRRRHRRARRSAPCCGCSPPTAAPSRRIWPADRDKLAQRRVASCLLGSARGVVPGIAECIR